MWPLEGKGEQDLLYLLPLRNANKLGLEEKKNHINKDLT